MGVNVSKTWLVETVVSNSSVLEQYCSTVLANLDEKRADFFPAIFSRFGCVCVCECLPIVLIFLLSSPSFDHEESDSEHESSQKILSQKFEWDPGSAHGAKIRNFIKIRHVVRV